VDTVITNALIVDAVCGIVKADVGLKGGRIAAIGKAGNPDIQPGVTMAIGAPPKSLQAKDSSSLQAASTPTSISSVRSRSKRRSPRASPP